MAGVVGPACTGNPAGTLGKYQSAPPSSGGRDAPWSPQTATYELITWSGRWVPVRARAGHAKVALPKGTQILPPAR
ncbi:hypothetical protein GCM10027187_59330 [Streptosporangium sandarakinum]